MPFTSGTITAAAYRTERPCPPDARERFGRTLARHAFKPINPDKGEILSIGWVDPHNILSGSVKWDQISSGPYVFLGLRTDKKSVPGSLLRAHVREALRQVAREKKTHRLSRTERDAIRERITADLIRQTSPSTSIHEAVWNTATGEVLFSTSARAANDAFMELFQTTFDLLLLGNHPIARAQETAASLGRPEGLRRLPPSFWGTGPRIVETAGNSADEEE